MTSIFGPLRRWPELHSGGVNVTAPVPSLAGDQGTKDTLIVAAPLAATGADRRHPLAAVSCAPGERHLRLVPPLNCSHKLGSLTCTREPHPSNPGGHVYESGSWVRDRHGDAS